MAGLSSIEQLPTEIAFIILSFLTHPRSRLPGLSERQSDHDYPMEKKTEARKAYYMSRLAPPDTDRFAVNLFQWRDHQHPFNVLAMTSRRMREHVERFCAHLVKIHGKANSPVTHAEHCKPATESPDPSGIVYRKLWLQYAPRLCVYCNVLLSEYPHRSVMRPISACRDCFYAQVYSINEVAEQFHLSGTDLSANGVRGFPPFVLRVDVEALVLRLYGTKQYHDIQGQRRLCNICVRAGTIARTVALRAARQSRVWDIEPSEGWLAREKIPRTQNSRRDYNWFDYLEYRRDPYLYKEEDVEGNYYYLRLRSIGEEPAQSHLPFRQG
ncbi:uncharacterized protein EI97DRAFT_102739 [Westerdykella ornata]|uniref:Uncharacterized protein n=1 Tax=Westerdykella ornata TaxID=318751 RepID=A0A6A6JEH7_WESOR|nr:uncharacterized protein EI97DRAFT_102739 [Westerdykella ornata]KAF2274573.1 hypothetical protein EI97DRAFT_102739 [Westerdykella ornata]